MAWGLFKKVVIADRLSLFVGKVYGEPSQYEGPALAVATVFFAFQIFCDFSGYSDIAIGAARVMGFRLMRNFDAPYHSQSISEFWRRWHISLSTWFRDYLYIPLGGNRVSVPRWYLNLFLVFLVSGLWHGANWTYVIWGAMHGVFLIVGTATESLRSRLAAAVRLTRVPRLHTALKVACTFLLVCLSWVFFRAKSLDDAVQICAHLFSGWSGLLHPNFLAAQLPTPAVLTALRLGLVALAGMALVETVHIYQKRFSVHAAFVAQPFWVRWSAYYAGVAALMFLCSDLGDQFIYFQF
jgi:alginate O-acetyltransferase complex protein AlgI